MKAMRMRSKCFWRPGVAAFALVSILAGLALKGVWASDPSSYAPVVAKEKFEATMARMAAAKPAVMKKQMDLLDERYDMSDRPAPGVTMSRGKAVQEGIRVNLPSGVTWESLAEMTPAQIREKDLFPQGFLPLPHPNHPEGGMVFPQHPLLALNGTA